MVQRLVTANQKQGMPTERTRISVQQATQGAEQRGRSADDALRAINAATCGNRGGT